MKPYSIHQLTLFTFLGAAAFLTSCGEKSPDEATISKVDPAVEAVFVDAAPEETLSVIAARKSAKAGDTVSISGKVAGTMHPFTEGYATMVVSDTALRTCDLIPGDSCETPWDACCEEPEKMKASRMTVRIIDAEGMPVASELKGVNGLTELSPVVVTGKVADESTPENLIVDATMIHVEATKD